MAVDLVTLGVVCADVMVRPVESLPPRGTLRLVPQLELHLGGLAAVTAAVFSQLGGRAAYMGRVGSDSFGDYLLAALERAGVNVSAVKRDPEHHSSATVVCIAEDGERTFFHHMGTNATMSEADVDYSLIARAKVFHWGGPGIMPGLQGKPMGRVFQKVKALGVVTSMDTCYDGSGTWFPLIAPSLPHLDIVFSSLEEARAYTGQHEPDAIADFYLRHGVKTAVIKLGADGIFVKNEETHAHIPAHRVNVIDSTGAGDAACGGFLFGYVQGWDVIRCARLANAVGALTVQHMGGAEAIDDKEEVFALMNS